MLHVPEGLSLAEHIAFIAAHNHRIDILRSKECKFYAGRMIEMGRITQEELSDAGINQAYVVPASTTFPHSTPGAVPISRPEVEYLHTLGKQLGKLQGAVNNDLQRLGGDVLTLKAEYEKAWKEYNV